MNNSALLTMVVAISVVIFMTAYYFIKVLRTPPRDPKNDSFIDT